MSGATAAEWLTYLEAKSVTPRPDCMLWNGAVDRDGYGKTRCEGRDWAAHRLAWTLTNGEIPEGLTVDHLCRVRSCLNTEHMELVTHAENIRRKPKVVLAPTHPNVASRQALGTYMCNNGLHLMTEANVITYGSNGRRLCAECKKATRARQQARRRAARAAKNSAASEDPGKAEDAAA